jgi:hypothetical protein
LGVKPWCAPGLPTLQLAVGQRAHGDAVELAGGQESRAVGLFRLLQRAHGLSTM